LFHTCSEHAKLLLNQGLLANGLSNEFRLKMSKVKCRCGNEVLFEPAPGADTVKVLCHRCGSRIRVRISSSEKQPLESPKKSDGFVRFFCPCGRRLKVIAKAAMPSHGRCPDCGRTVPVPAPENTRMDDPAEMPTSELSPEEVAVMNGWRSRYADH
jgi:hypothetical protein